jgi:ArsR family transcriptional regulator
VYYRLNPDLPEWALAVLNIISQQDVSPMTRINPTIATHCE